MLMTASYITYQPEQQQLLPSALQDWLPQGHLAYFINDTVDNLDLSSFHARYDKGGPVDGCLRGYGIMLLRF